jgi:DNA-binding transcriptional LysR family regulator
MRRFNISTTMIRSFLEIADQGNVTRAASRLNSTQSTLSHQIQKLEAELDAKLFHRKNNAMEKTSEGEYFHLQAEKIVKILEEIDLYFLPQRERRAISIGIVNDCFKPSVISTINAFNHAFPDIKVDFVTSSSVKLLKRVQDGELEMAIVRDLSPSPDIGPVLWSEPLTWAGGPAYKHGDGPLPLVFFPDPCVYRRYAVDLLEALGISYRIVSDSSSWTNFERSLRSGTGVSLVTEDVCKVCGTDLDDPRLPSPPPAHACLVTGKFRNKTAALDLVGRLIESSCH